MQDVEAGEDHDASPGERPDIRQVAEDEKTKQYRPDHRGVFEWSYQCRLTLAERLDHQIVGSCYQQPTEREGPQILLPERWPAERRGRETREHYDRSCNEQDRDG